MAHTSHHTLSRRERQIMDIIYKKGDCTAAEVMDNLPDPPSYSAVRALLRILEEKKHLRHRQEGPRYVYSPTVSVDKAKKSALHHVITTFFEGSVSQAVAALLDLGEDSIPEEEMSRLSRLVDRASREGR